MGAGRREKPRSSCDDRLHVSTHGYLVFTAGQGSGLHTWLGQGSPMKDCDSGGPAIVELSLGRPETLRPYLSAGLPLSESRGLDHITSASHQSCDEVHNSSSKKDVAKRRHWFSLCAF